MYAWFFKGPQYRLDYSNVPNKRACMFISGKVCLLTLIEPKKHARNKPV